MVVINIKTGLTIYQINTGINLWRIPAKIARELDIEGNRQVELKLGSLSTQVKVSTNKINKTETEMGLTKDVLNFFGIPENCSLAIKSEGSGVFRLGPLIGILTFSRIVTAESFNRYLPYALKMKKAGLVYVFRSRGIHSKKKTTQGFYYDTVQKTWLPGTFPYPDVVMDRVYPNHKKTHRILEKAIGPNRIFNKKTRIDKMEFYQSLSKDPFLHKYVPETKEFKTIQDFENMLKKYPVLYLKPLKGMKGKGIVQISKKVTGFLCRYMEDTEPRQKNMKEPHQIFEILKHINQKESPYIIQSGIKRMTYRQRPFGLRVMATKGAGGEWSVPAIFSKITGPDGFLTNNSAGAELIFLNNLYEGVKNKLSMSKSQFLNQLSDLSAKAAEALDRDFGPLGKLGLDLVVDQEGKPWLIEANGNPGLMPAIALKEYPHWNKQMYDYPLGYCLYLCGFNFIDHNFPD